MSSTTINDPRFQKDIIGEIFRQSDTVDQLYMREVHPKWNQVSKGQHKGEDLMPPHLIETLQQLKDIKDQIDDAEKEVNELANRVSRLDTVQDNMKDLCVAAAIASGVSAVVYVGVPAFEMWNEQCRERWRIEIEANPEEYARRNEQCLIL